MAVSNAEASVRRNKSIMVLLPDRWLNLDGVEIVVNGSGPTFRWYIADLIEFRGGELG